jgi:hypothetical protein
MNTELYLTPDQAMHMVRDQGMNEQQLGRFLVALEEAGCSPALLQWMSEHITQHLRTQRMTKRTNGKY